MGIQEITLLQKIIPQWEWDKVLFAEDLVSHFMSKLLWNGTPFAKTNVAPKLGCCRGAVRNGFSEYVRRAVDIIQTTLDYRIRHRFIEIAVQYQISYDSFVQYASDVQKVYLSAGSNDAIQFLKFCVFQSVLAVHFYKCGYKKAPDMVTSFIFKAFPVKVMSPVTWETLRMASKSYASQYEIVDVSSDLNKKKKYRDPENNACDCFLETAKGRSFRVVFRNRERILKRHIEICLGLDSSGQELPFPDAPKTETPKQSTSVSDFSYILTEPPTKDNYIALTDPIRAYRNRTLLLGTQLLAELFGTDMGSQDYELPGEYQEDVLSFENPESSNTHEYLRMYRNKTENLFGSQIELQGNEFPDESPPESDSIAGHQQTPNTYDALQVYRHQTEIFFGSETHVQRHENSTTFTRSTLDVWYRQASSPLKVLQTESGKSEEFCASPVELREHGNLEMVPENISDIGRRQTSTTDIVNKHYAMRSLQDVQMQISPYTLFDCPENSGHLATGVIRVQRIVRDFFRFQDEIVSKQNVRTADSKAPSMPAGPILPNIDYDFLIGSTNDRTRCRGEESTEFSEILKAEFTTCQRTEALSVRSPEVIEIPNNSNANSGDVADMIGNLTIQNVSDASCDRDVCL